MPWCFLHFLCTVQSWKPQGSYRHHLNDLPSRDATSNGIVAVILPGHRSSVISLRKRSQTRDVRPPTTLVPDSTGHDTADSFELGFTTRPQPSTAQQRSINYDRLLAPL